MKTEELSKALSRTTNFEHICRRHKGEFIESDLAAYLTELLERYHLSKSELILRADLEKGYAYQIFRGERIPGRDNLLAIALGIGCSLEETQKLLKLSGRNELYPRIRRDAAIMFCIYKHFDLHGCQDFLQEQQIGLLQE